MNRRHLFARNLVKILFVGREDGLLITGTEVGWEVDEKARREERRGETGC